MCRRAPRIESFAANPSLASRRHGASRNRLVDRHCRRFAEPTKPVPMTKPRTPHENIGLCGIQIPAMREPVQACIRNVLGVAVDVAGEIHMTATDRVVEARSVENLKLLHRAGAIFSHRGGAVGKRDRLCDRGCREDERNACAWEGTKHDYSPKLDQIQMAGGLTCTPSRSDPLRVAAVPLLNTEPKWLYRMGGRMSGESPREKCAVRNCRAVAVRQYQIREQG